jgi:hypothetical protein
MARLQKKHTRNVTEGGKKMTDTKNKGQATWQKWFNTQNYIFTI